MVYHNPRKTPYLIKKQPVLEALDGNYIPYIYYIPYIPNYIESPFNGLSG